MSPNERPYRNQLTGSNPAGDEAVTVQTGVATQLTAAPADASHAVVEVNAASIRFRLTGAAPDWTGHVAHPGDVFHLEHPGEIAGFRAVAVSTESSLFVTYY